MYEKETGVRGRRIYYLMHTRWRNTAKTTIRYFDKARVQLRRHGVARGRPEEREYSNARCRGVYTATRSISRSVEVTKQVRSSKE